MGQYILRLDDATIKYDKAKWDRIEKVLYKYSVKPLVGVIPNCEDTSFEKYEENPQFWNKVHDWISKGWTIAMHGYNHVYCTQSGGMNPINKRSEFAGLSLDKQKQKIAAGVSILRHHGIEPVIFFAPSHTFDLNTLEALREESNIRIISDTVANDVYKSDGFTFVPQQSGKVRWLPFKTVTFCYHPNTLSNEGFLELENFLEKNNQQFVEFPQKQINKGLSILDRMLRQFYFIGK